MKGFKVIKRDPSTHIPLDIVIVKDINVNNTSKWLRHPSIAMTCIHLDKHKLTNEEAKGMEDTAIALEVSCRGCNGNTLLQKCHGGGGVNGYTTLGYCTNKCTIYAPPNSTCDYGIVIGSYGMPAAVLLNIAAIRHFNSHRVPILVHDDCTPEDRDPIGLFSYASTSFQDKYRFQIKRICPQQGHMKGDLSTYIAGLEWAKYIGLKFLIKLSQRFIPKRHDWIIKAIDEMKISGQATMSQRVVHGGHWFGRASLRTEAMVLDVDKWSHHIQHLKQMQNMPCVVEHVMYQVAVDHVHPGISPGRWRIMNPDRHSRIHDLLWHDANSDEDYLDLAKELGVDLTGFSSAGWNHILGSKWKLF